VRISLLSLMLSCALTAAAAEKPPAGRPEVAYPFAKLSPQDAERVAGLIKQLGAEKWSQREAASRTLAASGETAIPGLLRAVRGGDEEVRYRAAELLKKLLPKARIVRLLYDCVRKRRVSGQEAVKRMGGPERAVSALVEFRGLAGIDATNRTRALQVMGYCGPAALEILTASLGSADTGSRRVAVSALGQLGPDAAGAVPALAKLAADEDKGVRQALAAALGGIGAGAEGVPPVLVKLLADKEVRVRRSAAEALGRLGPPVKKAAGAALEKALADEDGWVRRETALALHKVGGAEALEKVVSALAGLLGGKDRKLRVSAAAALGEMGAAAKPAVPALVKALVRDPADRRNEVPRAALAALGEIGPGAAAAVPALIKLVEDPQRGLATSLFPFALATLGRMGPAAKEALPALQKLSDSKHPHHAQVRVRALVAQIRITGRPEEAIRILIEFLSDQSRKVRQQAAEALGDLGPDAKAAVPELEKLLKDRHKYVRRAAAEALKKIRAEEQKPAK